MGDDANSLLFCSIVSSLLHLLDLLVCLSPRHFHLSRFDEATQSAVTMTESHTQVLRTLEGHAEAVNSVAISADGQILVSGSEDKTIDV